MIDRLDITDEYSVNCDFILNTVIFIDAALNISLRKIWKCNVLSFYLFGQGVPNETKGTINLKKASYIQTVHEPRHVKTNKMKMRPVFAVRMKKAWVLSYPLSAQRRLWSDWADVGFCHVVAHIDSHFEAVSSMRFSSVPSSADLLEKCEKCIFITQGYIIEYI